MPFFLLGFINSLVDGASLVQAGPQGEDGVQGLLGSGCKDYHNPLIGFRVEGLP